MTFEWWSNDTGSVMVRGIDAVNITLDPAMNDTGAGLSVEEFDLIADRIVRALAAEFSE
jgi:hypothetical protein